MFKKKEVKNKVGRPKLADTKLKKESLIVSLVCVIVSVALLFIGAYELNIIPNTSKLKGSVNINLCTSIPEELMYNEETNPDGFKDTKFFSAVLSGAQVSGQYGIYEYNDSKYCDTITKEDLEKVTKLSLYSNVNVEDISGISNLTGLTRLYLESKNISNIDLSKNVNLTDLDLSNNDISNIDLSKNVNLTNLDLTANKITNINLSENINLNDLNLTNNKIASIDLSKNVNLINLDLTTNEITNIDLSSNTGLKKLVLDRNNILNIDLSKNVNLNELALNYTDISSIDLSKNVELNSLYMAGNKIKDIDLSNNKKLINLNLMQNILSSVNLNNNVDLSVLYLNNNKLTNIDLSKNVNLSLLDLDSNDLTELDLSNNINLTSLSLSGLKLKTLDLSNNTKLTSVTGADKQESVIIAGKDKEYTFKTDEIITAYPNDTTVSLSNSSDIQSTDVAEIVDNKVQKKKSGQVSLWFKYKVSDNYYVKCHKYISFLELKSDKYNIDNENLIIDANGDFLSNVIGNIRQEPLVTTLTLTGDKIKISSYEFSIQNYILYKLESSKYTINDEYKTIDLNNDLLSNADSNIILSQGKTSYTKSVVDDKLNILDENKNVIDTYKIVNYRLYKLSSSYYTIDEENKVIDDDTDYFWLNWVYIQPSSYTLEDDENKVYVLDGNQNIVDTYTVIYKLKTTKYSVDLKNKEIDLNGELINNININVKPYQIYSFERKDDNLIIKLRKSGKIVDTFKITNYVNYKLSLNYNKKDTYIIDEKNKTIDLKGDPLYDAKRYIYTGAWNYTTKINDDGNLDIYNAETNEKVDTYTLLNKRENDDNAYLKAGFKDKNLYDAVLISYYGLDSKEDLKYRYVLSDEELSSLDRLSANNLNISDVTGINKLKGLRDVVLFNNNISGSLDLSMMPNLNSLYAENNNISSIKFSDENNLEFLLLHNNKLKSVDLSSLDNLNLLTLQNNLIQKVYLLNNNSIKFSNIIKLNDSKTYTYSISNNDVVDFKDGVINAKKVGSSKISISSDSIITYDSDAVDKVLGCEFNEEEENSCDEIEMKESNTFYEGSILVYDVKSNVYKVDNKNNKIDANNSLFDASKVLVEGLSNVTSKVEGNKLIILNDGDEVATYEIVNVKKIDNTDVKKSNVKISNSNNKKKYTVKAKNNKKEDKEENKDIEIADTNVNKVVLDTAKKTSKDIIIKNGDITFTIKHEDIPDNMSGINLDYEIREADGKKIKEGVVLKFKESKTLPFKILVDINVKNLKIDDTSFIYKYNKDDKFSLIAENVKKTNNRLKFYIDELSIYNITGNKIKDHKDSAILKENKKLNSNVNLIICTSAIFIIILLVIGIVYYNKNKKKIVS